MKYFRPQMRHGDDDDDDLDFEYEEDDDNTIRQDLGQISLNTD